MRTMYLFLSTLFLGGFLFLIGCKSKTNGGDGKTASEQSTTRPKLYHPKINTFAGLRAMAFGATPEQLHLSLPAEKTTVYGVIMDWGIDTSTATIVSYRTGDASLYLSSGGAVIGGGQHPNVSNAARLLVASAQNYLDRARKMETTSLPQQDEVKFYLLTNKGTYVGQEIMRNFDNKTSPWLPLFEQANKVLTELHSSTEYKN